MNLFHCVKCFHVRDFSGPNAGKYRPQKLRYLLRCAYFGLKAAIRRGLRFPIRKN